MGDLGSLVMSTCARMAFLALVLCSCSPDPRGPSVVIVVFDTFRADHVSGSGYARETTPVLDSLSRSGTSWTSFRSQSSWTLPAFASILTGLTPREHMAGRREGTFYGLDPSLTTMQRFFGNAGYRTAAFFNVLFLSEDFGFHVGFDHFDCAGLTDRTAMRNAGETTDAFLAWLDEQPSDAPFLAIVHFYDPHMPYGPPAPWDTLFTVPGYEGPYDSSWGRVPELMGVNEGTDSIPADGLENLVALYDGEIAYSDAQLGRLLAGIREQGIAGSTVIVVTGDHGEEFLDHGGMEHGMNLFEETVRVPLSISGPGVPSGTRDALPASQIDILPTLAGLCGMEAPADLPGRDLLGTPSASPRAVCASGILWAPGDEASCTLSGRKVIYDTATAGSVMFDLEADPGEQHPLQPDSLLLAEALFYWATPPRGSPAIVDFAETVDRTLRDLGYIR